MTDRSHSKTKYLANKSSTKKLLNFFLSLLGKKTKKSFLSVISHLVETYEKENLISFEEKKMIKNIASLSDKKVSSIMTPRADLIAIKQDANLEEIKKIITTNGHTRIPVFKETLDEIIGFIHSKDLSKFLCQEDDGFQISKILRKILFVPGSMKILDLMLRMRIARVHVAIVLDEFGGVDGFVTIENVMEEIVGDIEDEHDLPSDNSFFRIKKINGTTFQFGGRVEVTKMEEILQTEVKRDEGSFQTIAGLVMAMFRRVPEIGEEIEKGDLKFKVIDSDRRSVRLVEVIKNS
ncbi:MAG: HlyC/CorC family transporter [Proteobacteria bacterium]|nr:HlyC/CorC family transporter [Pseudomonadota bacterium]